MQEGHPAGRRLAFPLLDVVRAFAALSVLVYHLIAHWEWDDFPAVGPLAWFRAGWMAVDVFFVTSGLVIGLSAFARVEAQGLAFRPGFLRSRLARVVPLHYVTLAVFVLVVEPSLWRNADFGLDVGAHLLFLHNLFFPYYGSINGPNWSLGVEMQFYLLMLLAAPWLLGARPWKILLPCLLVAWAWRWGAHALFLPGPFDKPYMAQTQLPGMLDAFAVGLLLARLLRAPAGQSLLHRLATRRRLRCTFALLAALAWAAILALHEAFHYWEVQAMAVFFRTGLALCSGFTLLVLCGWPLPSRPAFTRVTAYLGKLSYGIYLWHLPVLLLLSLHTELAPQQALAIAVPATMALAALTWHLVEEPALRRWGGAAAVSNAADGAPLRKSVSAP